MCYVIENRCLKSDPLREGASAATVPNHLTVVSCVYYH